MLDMQKLCAKPNQGSTKNPWCKMEPFSDDDMSRLFNYDFKIDFEDLLDGQLDESNNMMNVDQPIHNDAWLNSSSLPLSNNENLNSNLNLELNGDPNNDIYSMLLDLNSSVPLTTGLPPSPSVEVKSEIDTETATEDIIENGFENGLDNRYVNGLQNGYENSLENGYESGLENGYENDLGNDYENVLQTEIANGIETAEVEIESDNGIATEEVEHAKKPEIDVDDENDTETENETTTETENDTEEEKQENKNSLIKPIKLKIALSSGMVKQISTPIQLTKTQTISKINATSSIKVHKVKVLQNPKQSTVQQVRKQLYSMHFAPNRVKTAPAKREKPVPVILQTDGTPYPKPGYSYSCLIAMALKNSRTGLLPVSRIYDFMCEHFPYFYTARSGWKNSVRHNLSLNKCFEKIDKTGNQRKGCLWAIHVDKVTKMNNEILKWYRKDPDSITKAMVHPEHLELLQKGALRYLADFSEETTSSEDDMDEAVNNNESDERVAVKYIDDDDDDHKESDDNVDITEQSTVQDEGPSPLKRHKVVSATTQRNYMPQRVPSPRRKTSVLLQATAGTSTYIRIN